MIIYYFTYFNIKKKMTLKKLIEYLFDKNNYFRNKNNFYGV